MLLVHPQAARTRLAALESVQVISAGDDAMELGRVLVGVAAARIEPGVQGCRPRASPDLYAEPALGDGNMRNRISDPIVDEVRRVRAELAVRHGNDDAAIIRHAQAMERQSDRACVRYPARHVAPAGDRRSLPSRSSTVTD